MYFRKKISGGRVYLQIAESRRAPAHRPLTSRAAMVEPPLARATPQRARSDPGLCRLALRWINRRRLDLPQCPAPRQRPTPEPGPDEAGDELPDEGPDEAPEDDQEGVIENLAAR
jgi:hypothetical protein